jgi:glycosyltransferase involved in cell wall biosynthesis
LFGHKSSAYDKKIVVLIPSYNNIQYYQKNLDSVFNQDYKNFFVIYIDDHSTDGTAEAVETYIQQRKLENKIMLIKNATNRGCLANIYTGVHLCDDKNIIVDLDGDDWLKHNHVLSIINDAYADTNVWLTYGTYEWHPDGKRGHCRQIPMEIIKSNGYREYSFVSSHLRTFYAWLFKEIKKEDLMYENDFFRMSGDQAFMFPLLEMAGHHSKYISEILYVYNAITPLNDHKKDRELQVLLRNCIRALPKYSKLSRPKVEIT